MNKRYLIVAAAMSLALTAACGPKTEAPAADPAPAAAEPGQPAASKAMALPATTVYRAFTPAHLIDPQDQVEVGTSLLVVGFPLGFHDTLHHMPVVRHAAVASSFGLRFQGKGYFLTDARTHRGT